MSVNLTFYPLIISMLVGVIIANAFHLSEFVAIPVFIVFGILGMAVWIYSPLPNHNGGFGAPAARMQKWGWTTEPQAGYEEPTPDERMKIPLSGFMWAEKSKEEGDES